METLCRLLETKVALFYAAGQGGALRLEESRGLTAEDADRVTEVRETAVRCASERHITRLDATSVTAEVCRAILRSAGAEHLCAVPLLAYGELRGVLTFAEEPWHRPATAKLESISAVLGLALAARRGLEEPPIDHVPRIERDRTGPSSAEVGSIVDAASLAATLEREQTNLRHIVQAAPDGILFLDALTGRVLLNRAFEELLGRPIEASAGVAQEVGIVHWPDGRTMAMEDLPSLRALRAGERVRQELLFVHDDGRAIPVDEHAAPIRAADGAIVGVVVTCRDLTTQKELERHREEFAAMVAHDLRNPIQSILVQVEMLRRAVDERQPIQQSGLDRLTRLGQRLGRMASDLMDSARLDLSRVVLDLVRRDAVRVVRDVVDLVQPTVGDHPICVRAEPSVPPVLIDWTRFEQILTNLIENAAKYSEGGTAIEVSVKRVGREVEVAVRDRGVGIAPAELPRLFDRFYQTGRARERKTGLGLGLYITKGYVEAHGGRLTVESATDRGSTFRVFLPAAYAQVATR
jgi:PAS domain S-box-containing protein